MTQPGRRRADIQGLRGVASLLVATHHIWFGTVSGGVDAFFVLGGFLFVSSVLDEVDRRGRFDALASITRLLGRITPQLGLMLLVVLALVLWLVPLSRLQEAGLDLLAAATFWENWRLAAAATDYLAVGVERSIIQHVWAIAVQTQWLVLAAVLVAVVVRLRLPRSDRLLALVLGAIAVASFAYALIAVSERPSATYFDSAARAWELCVGGIAAVLLRRTSAPGPLRLVLAGAGLAALLLAGQMPAQWLHPGPATLIPVVATLAMLAGGAPGAAPRGTSRLLSSAPLRTLGDLSFGLFLWHWPILWLVRRWIGDATSPVPLWLGLLILLVAIVAAVASRALVRALARRASWSSLSRLTVPAVAAVAIVLVTVGPVVRAAVLDPARYAQPASTIEEVQSGVGVALDAPGLLADGLTIGQENRVEAMSTGCLQADIADREACRTEPAGRADGEVWLVGDSQAVNLGDTVTAAVGDAYVVQQLGRAECPFIDPALMAPVLGEPFAAECGAHIAAVLELAERERPDVVVISFGAWWTGGSFPAGTVDGIARSSAAFADRLLAQGIAVVWLDAPPPAGDLEACALAQASGAATPCSFPLSQAAASRHDQIAVAMQSVGAVVVPTLSWFCDLDRMRCPIVVDGLPVYADPTHMSVFQSIVLSEIVGRIIVDAR